MEKGRHKTPSPREIAEMELAAAFESAQATTRRSQPLSSSDERKRGGDHKERKAKKLFATHDVEASSGNRKLAEKRKTPDDAYEFPLEIIGTKRFTAKIPRHAPASDQSISDGDASLDKSNSSKDLSRETKVSLADGGKPAPSNGETTNKQAFSEEISKVRNPDLIAGQKATKPIAEQNLKAKNSETIIKPIVIKPPAIRKPLLPDPSTATAGSVWTMSPLSEGELDDTDDGPRLQISEAPTVQMTDETAPHSVPSMHKSQGESFFENSECASAPMSQKTASTTSSSDITKDCQKESMETGELSSPDCNGSSAVNWELECQVLQNQLEASIDRYLEAQRLSTELQRQNAKLRRRNEEMEKELNDFKSGTPRNSGTFMTEFPNNGYRRSPNGTNMAVPVPFDWSAVPSSGGVLVPPQIPPPIRMPLMSLRLAVPPPPVIPPRYPISIPPPLALSRPPRASTSTTPTKNVDECRLSSSPDPVSLLNARRSRWGKNPYGYQ